MLTAFILLGLVAAACVPFALTSAGDEGEDDAPPAREDAAAEPGDADDADGRAAVGDLLEFLAAPAPPGPAHAGNDAAGGIAEAPLRNSGVIVCPPAPEPDLLPPGAGERAEGPDADIPAPLRPTDPDAPDTPGPDMPGLQPIGSADPDLPDTPGEDLAGVIPLLPVEDPDPFGDVPGSGDGPAVREFSPGDDLLEVTLFTDLPREEVTVEVRPTEDGLDGLVTANGQAVAVLKGAPGATVEDVALRLQTPSAR